MNTPTLAEVIRAAIMAEIAEMHVCIPAEVTEYDATKQMVAVRPLVKRGRLDETGERVVNSLPIINGVPVVFPGANAYRITFPIIPGDTVLLVFSESSIDKWLVTGGCVDPLDERRNALSDAIAIPGLKSFKAPWLNAPTDRMSMGNDSEDTGINGPPTIEIDRSEIRLGDNDAFEYVAFKSMVDAIITVLTTWVVNPLDGGGALWTAAQSLLMKPSGATKVKAR